MTIIELDLLDLRRDYQRGEPKKRKGNPSIALATGVETGMLEQNVGKDWSLFSHDCLQCERVKLQKRQDGRSDLCRLNRGLHRDRMKTGQRHHQRHVSFVLAETTMFCKDASRSD